jgi:hypothetical protein
MKLLQLVSVMLFALVSGVFWGTWFSLSRSISVITPATFLEVGRIMISNLGAPMSVLLPASLLSGMPLLYALHRRRESTAFMLALLAVALMSMAMAITLTVNVPLDYLFTSWTIDTLPPDWQASRDRWEYYHGLRTLLSVAALCSLVGSVLMKRNGSRHAYSLKRAA